MLIPHAIRATNRSRLAVVLHAIIVGTIGTTVAFIVGIVAIIIAL